MSRFNIVEEIFTHHSGDSIAVIDEGRHYTYADLKDAVETLASSLPDLSQKRVGLFLPNGIAHILWSLAALKRGGVLVPIPTELAENERLELVQTTQVHWVLSSPEKPWISGLPEGLEIEQGSSLAVVAVPREAGELSFEAAFQSLNPALVRFSSGTTASAKGVVLSHETLLARVRACNQGLKIGPGDRIIWTLPMAHHFAVSIVLYLLHGATTVIENAHLGESLFHALEGHQGTVLYGSPFHFALLAAYEGAMPVKSLRLAVSTASALSVETATAFENRFGIPLTQGLGVIEIGLPILNIRAASTHPDCVGQAQPDFQYQLLSEAGETVKPGEVGALGIQGPGMFDAYLSPWQPRSSCVDAKGFFSTGDLATVDDEGNLKLVGRSKSVINVGGMKCFPEEIEAVLLQHPDLAEVRVYPEPHLTFGQVPAADLVLKDPLNKPRMASLMSFCRSRIASYKIPLKYQFVEAIPKTASGKILRRTSSFTHET